MIRLIRFLILPFFLIQISCVQKSESTAVAGASPQISSIIEADSLLDIDFITGHFDPAEHDAFVVIPDKYADRSGLLIQSEVFIAFEKMWEAAMKDSIQLLIRSATRNFSYQKGIWERKWTGETILSDGTRANALDNDVDRALKILEYSAMPGTSRHHWGTELDFNNFNNNWFETGEGKKLFKWLEKHAMSFGFCRPYSQKGIRRPSGYNEEKWHWSYIPIASKYLSFAENNLDDTHIKGFKGDNTVEHISVVDNYILGINPSCK